MKEDIRFIEIQLPQDSEIIKALIASRNKKENIDSVEIFLYMGKGKKPLKIILRPKDDSDDFNVTTPLDTGGKAHFYIGKAQISISSADMFVKTPSKKYTVSTNLYSLGIQLDEEFTYSAESFIKKIKVLKDELGVAKETLRLTGDIFHILPHAKKRFNIVKNKINFEHFDSPKIDSLNQKEIIVNVLAAKTMNYRELFERMREFLNKLPITQIESLSQIDIDTKNGNKPSGYTSRIKTIYPDLNPSPIKKDKFSELENKSETKEEDHNYKESLAYDLLKNLMSKNQNLSRKSKTIHGDGSRANYKEQKVFVSSHALESDAVRAVEEWTRKLNKNSNNGDLFTTRGIKLINFGFIHGFKAEAEESANSAYAMHRTKTYSVYANIKINTTNIKENKLTVTEEDIRAAVICSLERLGLKKDEIKEMDKERLFFQAIRPGLSPLELRDMIKNDVSAPKATETIIVPFSIVLKDFIAYNHLLECTEQYKATFRFKDKEFKGEVKSIKIQYFYATTAGRRMASSSSIKAIVNIAITQECKDNIDNLIKELDSKEICVGSLGFNSITRSAGALYTIKSYAEKEDRQTIDIDMSLNTVIGLERFSHLVNEYSNFPFMVSTDSEQAARIIYCADTEEEAVNLIMNIKEKLKNRFMENKSKQFNFSIYNNYINIEIKSFSSDNTILKVQDVVLVASRDLGKYFVVAKLQ